MVITHKPHRLRVDRANDFLALVTFRRQKILPLPDVAPSEAEGRSSFMILDSMHGE